MRLLLLLSALLAALTGAGAGARVPIAPALTVSSLPAARAATPAHAAIVQRTASPPRRRTVRPAVRMAPVRLPPRPLYAERRRE